MPQFFVDKKMKTGDEVELRGPEAKHVSQVLRLKEGNWIRLSDGKGRSFQAIIKATSPTKVLAQIQGEVKRSTRANPPTLALAIIRGDRFEWALQKAVELGCKHIIPFRSERTVHENDATKRKLERWQKIAHEAAKQSGLPFHPQVDEPVGIAKVCEIARDFGSAVLFYEGEKETTIHDYFKNASPNTSQILIIGPEGGFADDEIKLARKSGIKTVSLGEQILRVETAAIAALAICQYESGNI